jgi:hypothetical protein
MELTLIPENQQYASKTHENFIKKTSLKEIVNRYNVDYKRHRTNKSMVSCIFHTRELLQHLVQHNMLSVELDHTNWFIFSIIEKDYMNKDAKRIKTFSVVVNTIIVLSLLTLLL